MKKAFGILTVLLLTTIAFEYHRLSKDVIPYFYNITTDIHPEEFWFRGIVEIQIDVLGKTDNITLHAVALAIISVTVYSSEKDMYITDIDFYNDKQFLILKFPYNLQVGKYKIDISYQGELNRDLKGLYATNFTPVNEYPR